MIRQTIYCKDLFSQKKRVLFETIYPINDQTIIYANALILIPERPDSNDEA